MNTIEKIESQIKGNTIVLYMKGTPQFPQCGFSAQAVTMLIDSIRAAGDSDSDEQFLAVNVLENPDIRQTLPQYAKWPTFPQLYIHGELVGGCDIMTSLYEQGELQKMVKEALQVGK